MRDFVSSLTFSNKHATWGENEIYFDDIYYYIKPSDSVVDEWEDVPEAIKDTYEKLGIPEGKKVLVGVTAQYESVVYQNKLGGQCHLILKPQ